MRPIKLLVVAIVAVVAGACGDDDPAASLGGDASDEAIATAAGPDHRGEPIIRIGVQDFGESAILAEVYGQSLEASGFEVEQVNVNGLREELLTAFQQGEVNLSLEYAASMLEFVNEGAGEATTDPDETVTLLEGHLAELDLHAPQPSPAIGTNPRAITHGSLQEEDGTGAPLANNLVPLVGDELVDAYGFAFLDLLDEISRAVDTASLVRMNERLELDGVRAEEIARDFVGQAELGGSAGAGVQG
jgi:glycine betaine/choline ABC-type transport system substrate-binding protein